MNDFNRGVDLDSAFEAKHGSPIIQRRKKTVGPARKTLVTPATPHDIEKVRVSQQDPTAMDWQYDPSSFQNFCDSKEHMNLLSRNHKTGDEGALSYKQFEDCLAIIGDDPTKIFNPKSRKYIFGGLLWSKGSGKDYICALIQAYISHVLLCLRDPQEYFGFGPGEPCDILNVGKKGEQAERVYFKKFRARILRWKWMLDKYNVVDEGKKFHTRGKEFPYCKVGTRSAEWMDKTIRAFSENSGNPEAFEGYNIIFYVCDEISGWVSEKERMKAEKILSVLRSSQGSRNTVTLTGLGMAISYPRQDDDIMFRLEKESKEPDSRMYFSRALQWEVKPKRFYSGDTFKFNAGTEQKPHWFDIPVELGKQFFEKSPEKAKMMYLLMPPSVQAQFFEYEQKIDAIIQKNRTHLFKTVRKLTSMRDGQGNQVFYTRMELLGLNRQPDPDVDYVAWIDAGEVTCDASLSVGHLELVTLMEGSEQREVKAVVVDDTIVWEPSKKDKRIVDIGSMAQFCIDSLKYIKLRAVWWDHWNSSTGVYDLRKAGLLCDRHDLSGEDYDFLKSLIYTNRLLLPTGPEAVKGVGQLKHLSITATGNVTTGSSLHKKDVADTWCGVATLLLGSLVKIGFNIGRAPSAISIGSGGTTTTGKTAGKDFSPGAMARQANPFGGAMNAAGRQLLTNKPISDHSDLFPGLGRSRLSGATTRKGKPGSQNPGRQKLPRGIRL